MVTRLLPGISDYRKSGLRNRWELSASFLEDLARAERYVKQLRGPICRPTFITAGKIMPTDALRYRVPPVDVELSGRPAACARWAVR